MTSKEFLLQMKYIEPLNGIQQILNYTKIISSTDFGPVMIGTELDRKNHSSILRNCDRKKARIT
jgi:hypothetical protein